MDRARASRMMDYQTRLSAATVRQQLELAIRDVCDADRRVMLPPIAINGITIAMAEEWAATARRLQNTLER